MPVDPQIQMLLDLRAALPPLHTLTVAQAREQFAARAFPGLRVPDIAQVTNRDMQGPGGSLALRVYTPLRGTGPEVPFPLMMFFHGSGFVVCSLDTHDGMCRNLCAGSGCVVVSVDYRLAPEHKFPAGSDDCLAATRWAMANAAALGADPGQMFVAGDSAGGNLAAVTALRIRDSGGPPLLGQLLIYPVTDHYDPGTTVDDGKRRGLRTDPEQHEMVSGPLPGRSGGGSQSLCQPVACHRPNSLTAGPGGDRRIRSAARRG